jgi:hypothetical protein
MEMLLTILGLCGVGMSLAAYGLLTRGLWTRDDPRYYWLNIAGTLLIGLSLLVAWNNAAMISQILWLAISAAGLVRAYRSRRV